MATYEKYLLECKWKDLSFPITNLHTELKQDVVEHKYPDRDGAHVESTGRSPLKITCQALFYNNISRGKGETWNYGTLFPTSYLEFMEVCKDRSAGVLQHPFLGTFDAKLVSMTTELTADRRDGVTVNLEWVETIKVETFEDENAISAGAAIISDAQEVEDAFADLPDVADAATLKKEKKISFLDAIDSLKAFIDTATLIGLKALAQIDKVLYHINSLINSIERIDTVLFANVKSKLQSLKAALNDTKAYLNKRLGEIRFYIVPRDTTMGQLSAKLNNKIVDLIKLNPVLCTQPTIKALTPVKYYKI